MPAIKNIKKDQEFEIVNDVYASISASGFRIGSVYKATGDFVNDSTTGNVIELNLINDNGTTQSVFLKDVKRVYKNRSAKKRKYYQ